MTNYSEDMAPMPGAQCEYGHCLTPLKALMTIMYT